MLYSLTQIRALDLISFIGYYLTKYLAHNGIMIIHKHKYGHYIHYIYLCTILLLFTNNVFAKTQPKFTIIPTTPTSFTLSIHSTATVRYQVTNKTQIRRQLTMTPITGITQQTTGSGVCSNPFTLAHGESCLLTLLIHGDQINRLTIGGPVICKTKGTNDNSPDPFLCSQPSESDSLNISASAELFTISGTISGLTQSGLVLQNNGGDNLNVAANATTFQFSTPAILGSSYNVTIGHQPPGLLCTVSNGSGVVTGNVTNISVVCAAYVYLVDEGGGTSNTGNIVRCIFDTNTETLVNCLNAISDSTAAALNVPNNIVFNPTGSIAFVTNTGSSQVLSCSVVVDGFLQNCHDSGATVLNQPWGIVLNTEGTIAYITNNASGGGITYCMVSGGSLSACAASTATNLNEPLVLTLNNTNTLMFITNQLSGDITSCNVSGTTINGCVSLSPVTGNYGITFNTSNLNVLATELTANLVIGYDVSGNSLINPVSNAMPTLGGTVLGPTGILLNASDTFALVNMFPVGSGGSKPVICDYNGQKTLSNCLDAGAPAAGLEYAGVGGFF